MPTTRDDHHGSDTTTATVLLVLTCILTASSVSSTIIRCLARASQPRSLSWGSDGLILATTALLIARTGLQINQVTSTKVTTNTTNHLVEEEWVIELLSFPTMCLLKCSCCLLLLLLLQLNQTRSRRRIAVQIIMAGLIITNLEPAIVYLAECSPVKAYWDSGAGTCWPDEIRRASLYLHFVYSILFDLIFTLIPLGILFVSKLRTRDKILMVTLASMGCLVTASAVVEAFMMDYSSRTSVIGSYKAAIFANIELHVGVVGINVACIYYTPRPSSRILDAIETTVNKDTRINEDGGSVYSDLESHGLNDVSSETRINPSSNLTYTNNNNSNTTGYPNTVHTDDIHSSKVTDQNNLQCPNAFPLPRVIIRSFSKRKNSIELFSFPSSSSQQSVYRPYDNNNNNNNNNIDTNTLNEIITYNKTDIIPLKDTIQKVTEYTVISTRLSQSSNYLPGNGNWFISGKVPV